MPYPVSERMCSGFNVCFRDSPIFWASFPLIFRGLPRFFDTVGISFSSPLAFWIFFYSVDLLVWINFVIWSSECPWEFPQFQFVFGDYLVALWEKLLWSRRFFKVSFFHTYTVLKFHSFSNKMFDLRAHFLR